MNKEAFSNILKRSFNDYLIFNKFYFSILNCTFIKKI